MNNSETMITIVIPCYNVEKYIHRGLKSLMAQTFTKWNAILIDDGSHDSTGQICDEYVDLDSRFSVVHTKNRGVSAARNEGIKRATGTLLYFMDPDDCLYPNCLEKCYSVYKENKVDIIKFNYRSEWENGNESWSMNGYTNEGIYDREEIKSIIIPGYIGSSIEDVSRWGKSTFWNSREFGAVWRLMYNLSFIRKNNIVFNEEVALNEDGMFNCYALFHAEKVAVISDVLYCYTIRNVGAMTRLLSDFRKLVQTKIAFLQCREDIRTKYLQRDNIDIQNLYGGSTFLSVLELVFKGSFKLSNYSYVKQYISQESVKKTIKLIPFRGNIKIKALLIMLRLKLLPLLFACLWIVRKAKITLKV